MVTTPRISFEKQEAFSSREKNLSGWKKKTGGREEAASGTVHFLEEVRREKTQFRFILMDERAEFLFYFIFFYLRKEKNKSLALLSINQ